MIDIEKLCEKINLVDLAERAGATLRKCPNEWRGCCPLHGGKNPTAFVIANGNGRQRYRCYTGCNDDYWHDAVDFVQRWRNSDFMDAVTYLADMAGIPLSDLGMTPEKAQQITIQRKKRQERQELLDITAKYYAATLSKSANDSKGYAKERGWSDETIKAMLGYSDGNLLLHLRDQGADLGLAREAGIITQHADGTLADAIPRGYLVYVHRLHDQITYLTGRATFTNDQAKKSRNIKAPKQLFWATHRQRGPLIVVEGQACAITAWQWGYNAVALCGTSLDERNVKSLSSYPGIYLTLDEDATKKIKRVADKLGPLTMIVSGLPAHDLNDWLVKAQGKSGEMADLMERSKPWIEIATDQAKTAPGFELEERLDHLAQLVAKLGTAAQGRYIREICDRKRLTTRSDFRHLIASYTQGDDNGNGWEIVDGKLTHYGEPLGNWHARITHELTQDDGMNPPTVLYTIGGGLDTSDRFESVEVRAEDFDAMRWVGRHWGARPITYVAPGKTYQVRRCIQEISRHELKRERVYTFTGWKEIEGKRLYLTTTGGLGADGLDTSVRVDLGLNRLNHYALPDPPADLRPAIKASLDFLQLADYQVTVPILAAMYAAPLTPIRSLNAVLWVYGTTQSGKSTLSHLALTHFGPTFIKGHDYHAPADFGTSTVTSLEGIMFSTKDAAVILDDYAPAHSGATEARRIAKSAHYVVRSVGNRSGRGRARADLSEQTLRPPRGLVITTAENPLVGQSIVGRMIYVPVEPGQVIKPNDDDHQKETPLDVAQRQAQSGLYAQAMAGYIRWLAGRWDTIADELPARIDSATRAARNLFPSGQSRLVDYYGLLTETLRLLLAYAQEYGAIEQGEADNFLVAYQVKLVELLKSQGDRVASQSPVLKFWQALSDLLAQKKVYLAPKKERDFVPPDRADLIGWYDRDRVYLLTNTALARTKNYWESLDERFDTLADALRRELWQQGYVSKREGANYERNTYINKTVGRTRSLWIDCNVLFKKMGIDPSGERYSEDVV